MFSAVLSAIVLFAQAAATTPAPSGATATPDTGRAVSGVTVTGKTPLSDEQAANVVICHDESVVGSLFPKKICTTRRQAAERKANDQDVARDFQRSVIVGVQPH